MINGLEGERLTLGGLKAWPARRSLITVRLRPDSGRVAEHLRAEARDRAREDLAQQRRLGGNLSNGPVVPALYANHRGYTRAGLLPRSVGPPAAQSAGIAAGARATNGCTRLIVAIAILDAASLQVTPLHL